MPLPFTAFTRYWYVVFGIRPVSCQARTACAGILLPATMFSATYRVHDGLPLAPHAIRSVPLDICMPDTEGIRASVTEATLAS